MSKKLQLVALGLVNCIIDDAARQVTIANKEVSNYKRRLSLLVETRGLRVLTIDFPDSGKFLERSLERGFISDDYPRILGFRRGAGPRLFLALFQMIFNEDGSLKTDYSVEAVFWLRQIFYAVKKLRMESSDERTYATVSSFYSTDAELPRPTLCWDWDDLFGGGSLSSVGDRVHVLDRLPGCVGSDRRSPKSDLWSLIGEHVGPGDRFHNEEANALYTFQKVCDLLVGRLGIINLESVTGRHGKGAVSDGRPGSWKYQWPIWPGKLERTFPVDWFGTSDLGVTLSSVQWDSPVYRDLFHLQSGVDPQMSDQLLGGRHKESPIRATAWRTREEPEYPEPLVPMRSRSSLAFARDGRRDAIGTSRPSPGVKETPEDASVGIITESTKLIAVPKTQKAPRLIASEPTAHQWMQQGVADALIELVRRSCLGKALDITNQSGSRDLCLRASKTRSHATVDLSEASDRVSCWLVERVFRVNPPLLQAFHAIRSRLIRNPIDKKLPRLYKLWKFTTMGSAVTFPVQSVIFVMAAVTAVILAKGQRVRFSTVSKALDQVRVYGDDIIIPVSAYSSLVTLLEGVFLKVNETKSFVRGPFRESCGMDAVGGYSVTPAYFLQDYESDRPVSVASVVECSNNFFKVGSWKASDYVLNLLPLNIQRALSVEKVKVVESVPKKWKQKLKEDGQLVLALDSFSGERLSGKKRYNEPLQRVERRVLSLMQRVKHSVPDSAQLLLQYFTEGHGPSGWIDTVFPKPFSRVGISGKPQHLLVKRWVPDVSSG